MLWYKEAGFDSNPFSVKPAAFHNEIIGYNLQDMFDKIENGSMLYLKSPVGTGKTTILKHIIRKFGGRKKVVYYSHAPTEKIDVYFMLKNSTFLGRFFGKVPENMILLIDEAQELTPEDGNTILSYFESQNLKTVVFFGTVYEKRRLPRNLNKLLDGNVISLDSLTPENAIYFIRKRIGNSPILSDKLIREIYKRSYNNPRRLLENCEDICRHAVSQNHETVKKEHLLILGKKKTAKKRNRKKKKK